MASISMDTLTGLGVDSECRSGPSVDGLRMSESVHACGTANYALVNLTLSFMDYSGLWIMQH